MSDIPNTEYITINADGIFVGGKPATTYCGEEIYYDIKYVKSVFEWMQKQNPEIAEFHIMSSITNGEYAKTGNPSAEHGLNAWCRVKFNDGRIGSWVFNYAYSSVANCARSCAYRCMSDVRADASFRSAVLGFATKQQNVIGPKEIVDKKLGPNTK